MRKRELNLDLLRILASLMVIGLHVLPENYQELEVTSFLWRNHNFWNISLRAAVPLFFMISGKLFLEREKELDVKHFFTRNVFRITLIYIVWTILYAVDLVGVRSLFTNEGWDAFWIYVADAKYHLWFLPAMITVYLLMPILWSIVKYNQGKYVKYMIEMFAFFHIFIYTIRIFITDNPVLDKILGKVGFGVSGYAGYFLLGYYLSTLNLEKIKMHHLITGVILSIVGTTKFSEWYNMRLSTPNYALAESFTVFAFIETSLIFMIFLKLPKTYPKFVGNVITYLSASTLGIYLIHVYVLEHLKEWYAIDFYRFHPYAAAPIMALIVFTISLALVAVIRCIPIVNKWLV